MTCVTYIVRVLNTIVDNLRFGLTVIAWKIYPSMLINKHLFKRLFRKEHLSKPKEEEENEGVDEDADVEKDQEKEENQEDSNTLT